MTTYRSPENTANELRIARLIEPIIGERLYALGPYSAANFRNADGSLYVQIKYRSYEPKEPDLIQDVVQHAALKALQDRGARVLFVWEWGAGTGLHTIYLSEFDPRWYVGPGIQRSGRTEKPNDVIHVPKTALHPVSL